MTEGRAVSPVLCVLRSVPIDFGGLTRSVFERSSMFVDHGVPVTLLVRNYRPRTHEALDSARARGLLDSRVQVLCHWESAAPSADGGALPERFDLERIVGARVLSGASVETVPDGDGLARVLRHRSADGTLIATEDHDSRGRVVELVIHDPETGDRTYVLDGDGSPWWVSHIRRDGLPGRGRILVDGVVRTVLSRSGAQAPWLDAQYSAHEAPVVFVDSRMGDQVSVPVRVPQVRLVAVGHNNHLRVPPRPSAPFKPSWERLIAYAHHFDAVVLLTDEQRDDFAPIVSEGTVLRVIPHPAQVPPPAGAPAERSGATLVCLARFDSQKRLDHAVEAFALVVEQVPDARLDIYGSGPLQNQLQRLIDARGLTQSVTLLGYTSDPDAVLRGAAGLLMSSAYEGLPLVLFEALAVGCPVVSYDLKYGPRMVVRDGVDGLLAPDGDVPALAAAVIRLLTDEPLRRSMVDRAPEVLERFPRAAWERAWLDQLDEVVQAPRPDRSRRPQIARGPRGVSILVPATQGRARVAATVKAALAQTYPGALEVVVAVDPSAHGEAVLKGLPTDRRLRTVRSRDAHPAALLNAAFEESTFPVVLRADAGTVLPRTYVAAAVEALARTGADRVVGVRSAKTTTAFERAVATAEASWLQPAGVGTSDQGRVLLREIVNQVGGYDESVERLEDADLALRIRAIGGVTAAASELSVAERPPSDLATLAREQREDGRWQRAVGRTHPGTTTPGTVAAPLALAAAGLGLVMGLVGLVTWTPWLLLGLVVPVGYVATLLVAAARLSRRIGRRSTLWLLVVFPVAHAAWGWGWVTSPARLGPRGRGQQLLLP